MKKHISTFTLLLLFFSTFSQAAMITNGDFQNCDFSGWQKDTDGTGDPGATGDFSITDNGGQCSANISVDASAGASVFDTNTLSTSVDFSGVVGQTLMLSFDWDFSGSDDEGDAADLFNVALWNNDPSDPNYRVNYGADGTIGNLIKRAAYGSDTFSIALDSSFINQTDWTLEFSLQGGFNPGSLSSVLNIDNVTLKAVPEPSMLSLMLLTLATLIFWRQKSA